MINPPHIPFRHFAKINLAHSMWSRNWLEAALLALCALPYCSLSWTWLATHYSKSQKQMSFFSKEAPEDSKSSQHQRLIIELGLSPDFL